MPQRGQATSLPLQIVTEAFQPSLPQDALATTATIGKGVEEGDGALCLTSINISDNHA